MKKIINVLIAIIAIVGLVSCEKEDSKPEIAVGTEFDTLVKNQVDGAIKTYTAGKGDTLVSWKVTDSTLRTIPGKTIWIYTDSTDFTIGGKTVWKHTDSTSTTINDKNYWEHTDSVKVITVSKQTYAMLDSAYNQIVERNIKGSLLKEIMGKIPEQGDFKFPQKIFQDCKSTLESKLTVDAMNELFKKDPQLSAEEIILKTLMEQKKTIVSTAKVLYPVKN